MEAEMGAGRRRQLIGAILLVAASSCTFTVDSLADAPDADPGDNKCETSKGLCTLRAAVMESNESFGANTIVVPSGTYHLNLPIASGGGRLHVTSTVRLQGSGAASTIIDQDVPDIVILVEDGDAEINNVTVQGGDAQSGGGIFVHDDGELELTDSVLRDNFGFTGGGGLLVNPGCKATLRRTSILENTAQGAFGGGIWNKGELWVYESTIAGNVSNRAGGVRNEGQMNLRNVTVSGNHAESSEAGTGGISQNGFAVLNNVTIANNTGHGNDPGANRCGGIQTVAGQLTVVKNSVIAGNDGGTGPNDCDGELTADSKYNLIGDSGGCAISSYLSTFKLDVPANLGPLGSNGGPTQTHVPLATSQALNAGYQYPPPASDACQGIDQRGVPRPQGAGQCDLGAVEVTGANIWVTGFVLVNAATNADIRPLLHGDTLDLSELPEELSVRAVVSGFPGSVVFGLDADASFQTENVAPYALGGDAPLGDYTPVPFATGEHTVTATPFLGPGGTAAAGGSRTVTFHVKS